MKSIAALAFLVCLQGAFSCSCYKLYPDLNPWFQSRQLCLDDGGDLVSMETELEWSLVNSMIQKRTDILEWHIGLTNLTGTWKWLSNSSLSYDKWQRGEPEKVEHKRYVTMAKNWPIGTQGLFNSLRGDIRRARVCEYKKGCKRKQVKCHSLLSSPSTKDVHTTSFIPEKRHPTSIPPKNIKFVDSTRTTINDTKVNTSIDRKEDFNVTTALIIVVVSGLVLGCLVCTLCLWKEKRQEPREVIDRRSPKSCSTSIMKMETICHGFQQLRVVVESTDEQDDNRATGDKCEATENEDAIMNDSLIRLEGRKKDTHTKNCHITSNNLHLHLTNDSGLSQDDSDVIVQSDPITPTNEAQYASIVAVSTSNSSYGGDIYKQGLLSTFSPVDENPMTSFGGSKDTAIYATINSCRSPSQTPLLEANYNTKHLNYAELASFTGNKWCVPQQQETPYAILQIPKKYP